MRLRAILSSALALSLVVNASALDKDVHYIHNRSFLSNSFGLIRGRKEATVAFLGGSITEMKGWRDMVKDDLQRRFPETVFHFIDAGIPSLGSTPHAFRFEQDVLSHGVPDLMFLEAAVNDHTNEFGSREQILGMEGVVRHALRANPAMDIVMLHFIYDPFIEMYAAGEEPDVIVNHERVAQHYGLCSIDHAREIAERMADGEFSWEDFGGTHPAPLGHRYYADAIAKLLDDNMLLLEASDCSLVARDIPAPLDEDNYEFGELVPASAAQAAVGFELVQDWTPSDGVATRPGFVNVPMLATEDGGVLSFRFEGRAVGIFCVFGPKTHELEYSIDGAPYKTIHARTRWSRILYIPWVKMFADDLEPGTHMLRLRTETGCHIRNFVVNR